MKKIFYLFTSIVLCFSAVNMFAQEEDDLSKLLQNMSKDAVRAYTQPVITGFGSNLNSGWVSKVPSASKFDFHIDFKILGMGSFFGSADKTFQTTGLFNFTSTQADQILAASGIATTNPNYTFYKNTLLNTEWSVNMSGPTILGKEEDVLQIDFLGATIGGQQISAYSLKLDEVSGYLKDLSLMPTAAVQLSGGTFYGTDVAVRFFPSIEIGDLGKFSFFGIGFVHNPGVWLDNPLPLDLGVGYFTQTMTVGDIFSSTANQFGLFASKTFGAVFSVTPYGGLTYETSTTTIEYTYKYSTSAGPQELKTKFDLEGENGVGFTIGAAFKLAIVNFTIDYKLAKTKTATAGLVFGF